MRSTTQAAKRQGPQYEPPVWLHGLLRALLRHEPAVLALLDPTHNPFPDAPPRHGVRTRLAAFSFAEAHASDWWERRRLAESSNLDILVTHAQVEKRAL